MPISRRDPAPAPLYQRAGGEAPVYCHTCGRVITPRRSHASAPPATPVKFCSNKCRQHKPGETEHAIEEAFVKLLTQESSARKKAKGDPRNVVACSEVEELVFGHAVGLQKKGKRAVNDWDAWKSIDMESPSASDDEGGDVGGVPLPAMGGDASRSHTSHSTDTLTARRREGQRCADELEMVKQAARRGCVFGFGVEDGTTPRLCEAVMNGKIVEPSFAKGNWSVRWRET